MKPLPFATLVAAAMFTLNLAAATTTNQTFTIKVQDESGQPIAGAAVECYALNASRGNNPTFEKAGSQTTDSNGVAKVECSTREGQIVVRKNGFSIGGNYFDGKFPYPVITLGKPLSVSGIVLDEAEKPVPDALVGATMLRRTFKWKGGTRSDYLYVELTPALKESLSTRTGPDGRFRIEGLSAEHSAELYVEKKGHTLVLPSPKQGVPETMMCRAGQQNVILKIQQAGGIEGKVVVPSQNYDLSQISLTALTPKQYRPATAKVESDGKFRFENLAPGDYQISARFGSNQLVDWVSPNQTASVRSGQITRDLTLTATKGGVLKVVTLSTDTKKPLENVNFSALKGEDSRDPEIGNTDTNGVGYLRLAPGDYQVSAYKEGSYPVRASVKIVEGETNRVELELTPPRQVSGTVRDNQGVPVVGAEVKLLPGLVNWTKTDTNGQYRVRTSSIRSPQDTDPLRDPLFLLIRLRERNLAICREIVDGTETNDVQLDPALTASGLVQDNYGKPVTNAEVHIILQTGKVGYWFDNDNPPAIDAQGRFKISALPKGYAYGVNVTADGYGRADIRPQEPFSSDFEFAPITLAIADKQVAGVVMDADNKPAVGVSVDVNGSGQPRSFATTDENGRFSLSVCEGTLWVGASLSTPNVRHGSVRAQAGDTNLIITLGESRTMPSQPVRTSLVGKPLPDLTSAGIPADLLQTNKPLLVCIFDPEQRPSRRAVRLLGDQHNSLNQKGIGVLGLFSTPTTADALKEWKQSNPVPFPVISATEKSDKTKWISTLEKFPWLILTDAQGRVKAEGFDLDDLDAKLK